MIPLDVAIDHTFGSGVRIEFAFRTSEPVTALFGPSGAGKSSILGAIAGTLRPATGHVRAGEAVWFDHATRTFVPPEKRSLGVVFQDQRLFPHLNVAKNLRYGAASSASRSGGKDDGFREVVEALDLRPQLGKLPSELSGGERQRVAIGRALLRRPQLLLLDEPFNGMDVAFKTRLIHFLNEWISRHATTALLVTHDQSEVAAMVQATISI